MKIPMALASAALLAGTLAACGGDGDGGGGGGDGKGSDYCKELKKASKTFGNLSSGNDLEQLDSAFSTFHTLADEAPNGIDDDWKVLDGAIVKVEKALKDAGLTFADIAEIQQGKTPEGLDPSKLQGLAAEMSKLSGAEFEKASTAIEKHAKDTCKVDLNAS